jgi:hypothetical protein
MTKLKKLIVILFTFGMILSNLIAYVWSLLVLSILFIPFVIFLDTKTFIKFTVKLQDPLLKDKELQSLVKHCTDKK